MALKQQAARVRAAGSKNSNEDSMLAHISPREASLLSMYGGSGRTDPHTGLPHYDAADSAGNGIGGSDVGGSGYGGGDVGDVKDSNSSSDYSGEISDTSNAFGGFSDNELGNVIGLTPENTPDYSSQIADTAMADQGDWSTSLLNFVKNRGLAMAMRGLGPIGTVANLGYGIATSPNQNQAAGKGFGGILGGLVGSAFGPVGAMVGSQLGSSAGQGLSGVTANQGISPGELGSQGAQGMGGMGGTTNWGGLLNGAIQGLGSMYMGRNQANQAGQALQSLNDLYSPNSPYAQAMRQTLARKDAAAGRNSQYGPREAQLMAMLAQAHGKNLTSPGYGNLMGMQQRGQNMGLTTLIGLMQKGQPLNGIANQAGNYIGQGLQGLFGGGEQAAPDLSGFGGYSFGQGAENIPLQPEFGGGFGFGD